MFDKNNANYIFGYDNKIDPSRQTWRKKIIQNIRNENGDSIASTEDNRYKNISSF